MPLDWLDGVDGLDALTTPPDAPRSSRAWWLAGGVAIAAVAAVVVLTLTAGDSDTPIPTATTVETPPTTSPSFPSTVSSSVVSTSPPAGTDLEQLTGHTWVRVPAAGHPEFASEPLVAFDADGTIHGFDGCRPWIEQLTLGGGRLEFAEPVDTTGLCEGAQRAFLDRARVTLADSGGIRTLVITPQIEPPSQYVAIDSLPSATVDQLIGTWQPHTGERLTLYEDGSAELGPCRPTGRWEVDADGFVGVRDFDQEADETWACAGGRQVRPQRLLIEHLLDGDDRLDMRTLAGWLLAGTDIGEWFWLRPVDGAEPALDLRRGTISGFGPVADVSPEFVRTMLDGGYGTPTYDSGWYVRDEIGAGGLLGDCFGGTEVRTLVWDDVAFRFVRVDAAEQLSAIRVGDLQPLVDGRTVLPAPIGTPVTREGIGIGSTIRQVLDTGYEIAYLSDDDGNQVDLDDATYAGLALASLRQVWMQLDDGVITAINVTGFC